MTEQLDWLKDQIEVHLERRAERYRLIAERLKKLTEYAEP